MSGAAMLLVKGAVLGFSVAAPVEPIGVPCLRRPPAERRMSGLATGHGAAAAVIGAFGSLALGVGLLAGASGGAR